jgi:hypothetical protein
LLIASTQTMRTAGRPRTVVQPISEYSSACPRRLADHSADASTHAARCA